MASITTRAGKGSPLTNAEVDANFTNLNTELAAKLVSSDLAPYLTSASASSTYLALSGGTLTGNLAFSGTGHRITGDLSNATHANRVLLQSSTTNGNSQLGIIPNGTAVNAAYFAYNSSDPTNASTAVIRVNAGNMALVSGSIGSGAWLPMVFLTNNLERAQISVAGNFMIGTSVDNATDKLQVNGTIKSLSGGFVFPDGTTQATAAAGGMTTGKAIAMAIVFGG